MAKSTELNSEIFEHLLALLSPDRDEAGRVYEQLHSGLIRFFYYRGCSEAEALADETINRVASKLELYDPVRAPRISSYFYGFASKVLLEHRREQNRLIQLDEEAIITAEEASTDGSSDRVDCLRECLSAQGRSELKLIVEYYGDFSADRKEARRVIAANAGLSPGALHTKVFRIKVGLRDCVEKCLSGRKI